MDKKRNVVKIFSRHALWVFFRNLLQLYIFPTSIPEISFVVTLSSRDERRLTRMETASKVKVPKTDPLSSLIMLRLVEITIIFMVFTLALTAYHYI